MSDQRQRLRDPVHGLIIFEDDTDKLAWQLIRTPEFQRLRRIKQLGVSDFVFPGATHSRFAHCIGVYHNARKLMQVVRRAVGSRDEACERVVLLAALLHDIGHGPFSHAFEDAREAIARDRDIEAIEKHETFTAKLIRAEDGHIKGILDSVDAQLADQVAALIEADEPANIYHAVVSSSFDADRLDYLMRDRYMTGTQAGTIDYDWLIDNLATYKIPVTQDDDKQPRYVHTFVFKLKGREAAEDFLLARYRLYTQVYLHKTTRGFQQLLSALFQHIGAQEDAEALGLDEMHPLWRFLKPDGGHLEDYRHLDDSVVWGAIEHLSRCSDSRACELAERLLRREHLKVLDVSAEFGYDPEKLYNALSRLNSYKPNQLGKSIFRDEASYNLYTRASGEAAKAHKMVRVLTGEGTPKEITEFPDSVISGKLLEKMKLTRYYFFSAEERQAADKEMKGR